jgi:phytoene dehydrogenase-like protein
MWEEVAKVILEKGGEIHFNQQVQSISVQNNKVVSVKANDINQSEAINQKSFNGDYFFSTMPVKDLINAMEDQIPENVIEVADGLI